MCSLPATGVSSSRKVAFSRKQCVSTLLRELVAVLFLARHRGTIFKESNPLAPDGQQDVWKFDKRFYTAREDALKVSFAIHYRKHQCRESMLCSATEQIDSTLKLSRVAVANTTPLKQVGIHHGSKAYSCISTGKKSSLIANPHTHTASSVARVVQQQHSVSAPTNQSSREK